MARVWLRGLRGGRFQAVRLWGTFGGKPSFGDHLRRTVRAFMQKPHKARQCACAQPSAEGGEKASRSQRDVRLQRGVQLECLRFPGKIPQPQEGPIGSALIGYRQLVSGNVKGGPLPAIGCLHFDEALAAIRQVRRDIESCSVSVEIRNPPDTLSEISATGLY